MVVGLLVVKHLALKPLLRTSAEVAGAAVGGLALVEVAKDRTRQLLGLKR